MHTEAAEQTKRSSTELDSERVLREAPKSLVLIIDDDEGIRTALAELLELSGYQVVAAGDGQDALELLADGLEPNAIVLDLVMPRMDGWTFLSRLRADPKFHGVPVVVTSAVASEAPPDADVYLQKPFDLGLLDHEVARLCAH
jgi:CheY-like chemotaxis protein